MSLELIMGPMFSGKTSHVLALAGRYASIGRRVLVVNHALDSRYANANEIVTHSGEHIPCFTTDTLNALTEDFLRPFQVIIIDEAQFFEGLVPLVEFVVDTLGKKLYLVGHPSAPRSERLQDVSRMRTPLRSCLRCVRDVGMGRLHTFRAASSRRRNRL